MLATSRQRTRQPFLPLGESRARMLHDVRAGLMLPQKELQPTWFYDERGSHLFERITTLPEYYLTRSEAHILREHAPALVRRYGPASLAELGAGSADKTRMLLDVALAVLPEFTYLPVDVSESSLSRAAAALQAAYPGLQVRPVVADMRSPVKLPVLPRPLLYAFLGSTIGNFTFPESVALLTGMREVLGVDDRLLLGVDLVKDRAVLEAAYNDAQGVTAEFNLNVLRVLNRELGSDFCVDRFTHRAFYDDKLRRIEMHLVACEDQAVRIPGAGIIHLTAGETIRTEISTKYERADVQRMLCCSQLEIEQWLTDPFGRFALVVAAPSAATREVEGRAEP